MDERFPSTRRGPDNRPWYVVATAYGEAEAAIVAGLLKTAGIPTWVYWESAGRALGLTMGVLGTTDILTPEEYYEEAMVLLEGDDVDLLESGSALDDADFSADFSADYPGDFTVDGSATGPDDEGEDPA